MGIGDRSALPPHLDEQEEIDNAFPDDSQYGGFWKWLKKRTKHWLAFGHRSPKGIAYSPFPPFILSRQWRQCPVKIFTARGLGEWRYEIDAYQKYLSRQQLWCRWHIQIQWPLFFAFHWYWKAEDVLPFLTMGDRDGKLVFFYLGAKRDTDCFWYLAVYAGGNWK